MRDAISIPYHLYMQYIYKSTWPGRAAELLIVTVAGIYDTPYWQTWIELWVTPASDPGVRGTQSSGWVSLGGL